LRPVPLGLASNHGRTGGSTALSTVTTLTRNSDQRLMQAFHRRETVAARALYQRFGSLVYGVGLRILGDAARASAMVETTFVELWRRAPRYLAGTIRLDAWVLLQAVDVAEALCREPGCHCPERPEPIRVALANAGPIPA